jgi:hypothetical protein
MIFVRELKGCRCHRRSRELALLLTQFDLTGWTSLAYHSDVIVVAVKLNFLALIGHVDHLLIFL